MASKVTWDDIYKDFKTRCPRLAKETRYFKPCDYLTIKIWLKCEPEIIVYDYLTKRCTFVNNT